MTRGNRIRRVAPGFAVLAVASALAGCNQVSSTARLLPMPNRPLSTSSLVSAGRAALLPATVALDEPSEMSAIEPVTPTRPGSIEPSAGRSEPPTIPGPPRLVAADPTAPPTPLLDSALERANSLTEIVADAMAGPPPVAPKPAVDPLPVAAMPTPPVPPPPAPAEAPKPEEVWREGVQKLVGLARARMEQAGGAESPWALRARVVAWLAEPEVDPDSGRKEGDGVGAVLHALDDGPDRVRSQARGDEVRAAVRVLEDGAPLELVDLKLCSKVERFGDFEPFEPAARKAGQPLVIYCEVDGLRHESTTAGSRTRLAGQVEIVPNGGGPPVLARTLGIAEETCRRRRRDYYIAYKLVLPRDLPPGEYKLRLTEKDLVADRSATREVGLAIVKE